MAGGFQGQAKALRSLYPGVSQVPHRRNIGLQDLWRKSPSSNATLLATYSILSSKENAKILRISQANHASAGEHAGPGKDNDPTIRER